MLTFIPASTRPSRSQNAMNSRAAEVAAEHDLVVAVGLDVAGVLHAEVVLVGEEVGQPVVGGVLRRASPSAATAGWLQGVGPVLDAQPACRAAGGRRWRRRRRRRCPGRRCAGAASTTMPLSTSSPAASGQLDVGGDADPDDDQVGVDLGAVGELDARSVAGRCAGRIAATVTRSAGPRRARGAGRRRPSPTSGPSTRSSGSSACLEHGDLGAGGAGRGGGLQPDPARRR